MVPEHLLAFIQVDSRPLYWFKWSHNSAALFHWYEGNHCVKSFSARLNLVSALLFSVTPQHLTRVALFTPVSLAHIHSDYFLTPPGGLRLP